MAFGDDCNLAFAVRSVSWGQRQAGREILSTAFSLAKAPEVEL